MAVVRSLYTSQHEVLDAIRQLHLPKGFQVDLSYGNGGFYKGAMPQPEHRLDIDPSLPNLTKICSSDDTGLVEASIESAAFDPPFLTYVRVVRGDAPMVMARRFCGYWHLDELKEHYRSTLREAARILKHKGLLVFKCQDIVHNHRLFSTHTEILQWAAPWFRLHDLFIQAATHRMPGPNRAGTQKHARVFHCYWLVLQRWAK